MPSKQLMKIILKQHTHEKILSEHCEPGRSKVILVLDHLKPNFNVGKIFRSANAFGTHEVHLVGIPFFDPRSSEGGFKHTKSRSFETFAQCHDWLKEKNYEIFALDPEAEETLEKKRLPEKTAFVFGHEEFGFSFKPGDFPSIQRLKIPQYGKVQSLNVAIAASVAAYEYIRQNPIS